jgi:hypothetical protein
LLRDKREESPESGPAQDKTANPHEDSVEGWCITHVAHAGTHGTQHMLGRQRTGARWPLPTVEDDHDAEKGGGVEQKDRACAHGRDEETTQGRTDRSGHVDPDAIEGHGCGQLGSRHKFRHNGLPGWRIHRCPQAKGEA